LKQGFFLHLKHQTGLLKQESIIALVGDFFVRNRNIETKRSLAIKIKCVLLFKRKFLVLLMHTHYQESNHTHDASVD